MTEVIREFQNEFRFLSNFWPAKVKLDGVEYPSVEFAYQAAKSDDQEYRKKILACRSPGESKKLGRWIVVREDWEQVKVGIMEGLLHQKFSIPTLQDQLIATYPKELQEGNTWGDKFWGVDLRTGQGLNTLGMLLMRIRDELVCQDKVFVSSDNTSS